MLTGKRFRLKTDTMGIGTVDDKRVAERGERLLFADGPD
jgi:hypothetical protein